MWEDNFDHPVLNETDHWTVEVNGNGGGNNELQYYRRENISIEQHPSGVNCLVISAKRENFGGKVATSGRLVTRENVSAKYGKMEARIKLPLTANGLWPAFWMMGDDFSKVGWPRCGEIDILEMGNTNGINRGTQDKYFNGACHWGESWAYYAKDNTAAYSLQDDFHLFTMIWDETAIKMYLDLDKYPNNSPYFEMKIDGQRVAGQVSYYFHKPFSFLFNLAVGGNFTGITGNSNISKITALPTDGSPVKMYIDYVRIFQKGIAGEEYHGPALAVDNEIPTSFTATKGSVTPNSVELLLNATDNSGSVYYTVSYGTSSLQVSGTSNVQKSCIIGGLNPSTSYNFSIVAKDAAGNSAANNPIVLSATTAAGVVMTAAPTPITAAENVISVYSDSYSSIMKASGWEDWNGNTFSTVSINGNTTLKNTSTCCFGSSFSTSSVNMTGMTKLHVDVYPETATTMSFGLVTTQPLEPKKVLTLTTGQWNSIDVTLQELKNLVPATNLALVKQVGFWNVSGTFYIDNVYFYNDANTSINEVSEEYSILLYPNPIADKLTVSANSDISQIFVRNLLGQTVYVFTVQGHEKTVDLRTLSEGNYFVTVKLSNGQLITHKIVKL